MAEVKNPRESLQPADRGHPMPRRATAEKSVTLHHHRCAHEHAMRLGTEDSVRGLHALAPISPIPSSRNSRESGHSDPKKWFDDSNCNANGPSGGSMDVDPPFFQKETDSSTEEAREATRESDYPYMPGTRQTPLLRRTVTHSSSADDYRSVIDDLTIENKRLKEELKRYRQFGPDLMKKEKLFEIKVHGLPRRKKRELEATLRDFAAGLEVSNQAPSMRRKSARHTKQYSPGESMSKHASSSSSLHVDSAYASMSGGGGSNASLLHGTSLGRPSNGREVKSSDGKMENLYPHDTPEGLHPRHVFLSEKEKKKLVVRKLEQLFTGKLDGRSIHRSKAIRTVDGLDENAPLMMAATPQAGTSAGASREAQIQPQAPSHQNPPPRDRFSTSDAERTEIDGMGMGMREESASTCGHADEGRIESINSTMVEVPPEQRPTRPHDLDPDRVQIPSENMDYIRHLGLVPPALLVGQRRSSQDVSPDADGWVYLNLLCNLAQLHMVNVTPAFIRLAVSEKSAKFQLSPDGQKVRWRGGTDGTKFSSDSSGENSQRSPATDDTDGSDGLGLRRKQKTSGDGPTSVPWSKETQAAEAAQGAQGAKSCPLACPPASHASGRFHYNPLFVRHASSAEISLGDFDSRASEAGCVDSIVDNSVWDYSGCGPKKRRHGGAIVYFNGASFCLDLSGDTADTSPITQLTSSARGVGPTDMPEQKPHRTMSESPLAVRLLSVDRVMVDHASDLDMDRHSSPGQCESSDDDDLDFPVKFSGCDKAEVAHKKPLSASLEPSGLGGVLPEDHFTVIVTTRRTVLQDEDTQPRGWHSRSADTTDAMASRLACLNTSSPVPPRSLSAVPTVGVPVEVEYLTGRIKRLNPLPLPPPTLFFPSSTSDSDMEEDLESLEEAG